MALPAPDRARVLESLVRFDSEERNSPKWRDWESKGNFKYAIVHDGRLYPVKEVLSFATGAPTSDFSGGTQANSLIQKAGFNVEALHLPTENEVQIALHELLLSKAPNSIEPADAYERIADRFVLPARLRTKRMERSDEAHWQNRIRFARRKLVDAGIIDPAEHGRWKLLVRTQPKIWVEKSLLKGRPDRAMGLNALGSALWSPTSAQNGADIYRNMRLVQPNDIVLHLTDNAAFTGVSIADSYADSSFIGVEGTTWEGLPSYRVTLRGFSELNPPLTREGLVSSKERRNGLTLIRQKYSNLFYDPDLDLHQGGYLTEAPSELVGLLDQAYREIANRPLPLVSTAPTTTTLIPMPAPVVGELEGLIKDVETPAPSPETGVRAPEYLAEEFSEETAIPVDTIRKWEVRIRRKQHVIFQGPPGTGKTFVAERLARLLISGRFGFSEILQFHPSYGYEDFMHGLRPTTIDGQLIFERKHGRFMQFCDRAARVPDGSPCVLIIDEINRGNLSRIFGELMYLLEYRDKAIPLAGEDRPFCIPQNVFLVGTMNTADRSIALVDHALRRRFSFFHLGPDYEVLRSQLKRWDLPSDHLVETLQAINASINDRSYEVGISFFLKDGGSLRHTLQDVWEGEIEPYLEEFFYDQTGKVEPFRWKALAAGRLAEWAIES